MAASGEAFRSFQESLAADFPPTFLDSAFLLQRLLDGEAPLGLSPGSDLRLAPVALEKFALRGLLERPRVPQAQVLVTHFPGRPDYAPFLAPVAAELRSRGRSIAIALPPYPDKLRDPYADLPTFHVHALTGPATYRTARSAMARLRSAARSFERRYRLGAQQRAYLSIVLQAYCWQRALFRSALSATGAELVLGFHTMLDPGLRGALRAHSDHAGPTTTVFVQHGVFSRDWPTHDFHGADAVLLWGQDAARELAHFPPPLPRGIVCGNPKLEWLRQRTDAQGRRPTKDRLASQHVLFLGTNGEAGRDTDALRLVASALPQSESRQVTYRPHPAEPRHRYQDLVREGTLSSHRVDGESDVYDALRNADVVVGTQSTLLLEAVALGVPAVQLMPERLELNWAKRGMPAASTPNELRAVLDALADSPNAGTLALAGAAALAEATMGRPQGSARRAADAIERMLDGVDEHAFEEQRRVAEA